MNFPVTQLFIAKGLKSDANIVQLGEYLRLFFFFNFASVLHSHEFDKKKLV